MYETLLWVIGIGLLVSVYKVGYYSGRRAGLVTALRIVEDAQKVGEVK